MAYTIKRVWEPPVFRDGMLCVRVEFAGDTGEIPVYVNYEFTDAPNLPAVTDRDLARLNRLLVQLTTLVVGPIAVAPPPDPQSPPTPAEVAREDFVQTVQIYRARLKARSVGLATQAQVDAATGAMTAAYRAEYASLLLVLP